MGDSESLADLIQTLENACNSIDVESSSFNVLTLRIPAQDGPQRFLPSEFLLNLLERFERI